MGLGLAVPSGGGLAQEFPAGDLRFFEREVRPVLVEHCYECHSVDAKKVKGGLYLDAREGFLEGGDTGPSLVPGDPGKSLFLEAVRYENVDLQMPPKTRLSAKAVEALERWVTMGAPWPKEERRAGKKETFDIAKRKAAHWCWQPLREANPPAVKDAAWPRGEIDRFILAKLEERDLRPAPDADRRTFIRRVTFDLTGLPPTPEEVEAFVADRSPEAVETLVDRLLASPRFGEKWARHWMDLVRYAESYGHEFDYTLPHAWRYRDYLIRALNADVPYDDLLTEHIAGDLLESPRRHPKEGYNESVQGTGFWFLGEAVHAPTDIRADEADRIDNQIDVFSRAFLGLTVSCARCHDHKFDAISARDYFALAGFLQSTRRAKVMLDPGGRIASAASALRKIQAEASEMLRDHPVGPPPPRAGKSDVIADFDRGLPPGWTVDGEAFPKSPTPVDRAMVSLGRSGLARRGVMDSGLYGNKLQGVLRSPNFVLKEPVIHLYMRAKGPVQVRVVIDGYFMHEFHPLLTDGTMLNEKTITTGGKWAWRRIAHDLRKYVGHRVYLEFSDLGNGSLALDEITYRKRDKKMEPVPPPDRMRVEAITPLLERAAALEAGLPPPVRVLGVRDGPGENEHVHVRGNSSNLGPEVPRAFLTAIGGGQVPSHEPGSGRLLLAREVTAPGNPLTARVMVNRLWHHLTGRGLVPTVDDFGEMGLPPSHPGLLDWMARDFMDRDWSLKQAIRGIVLSRTYAMSCAAAAEDGVLARSDPENILLHKFRVRRLTSEAVRDGILATSGRLDRRLYGKSVPVHLTPFMHGRGKPKSGPLDGAGRRSIYTEIRRNFLPDFQMAFDMPSPFSAMGRRSVSNVPAQSLVMMNDPFVSAQAAVWAKRLCRDLPEDGMRIERAYREAFARAPSEAEHEAAQAFLQEQGRLQGRAPGDPEVWADFCHVLFNQKEFLFLR